MPGLGLRRIGHTVEVEDTPSVTRDDQQSALPGQGRGINHVRRYATEYPEPGSGFQEKMPSELVAVLAAVLAKQPAVATKVRNPVTGGSVYVPVLRVARCLCRSVCPSMVSLRA